MWAAVAFAGTALVVDEDRCHALREYHAARDGVALLVLVDGEEVCRDPAGPFAPRELASGTKSFSGLLAVALVQRGLLDLDEPVARTIPEWAAHPDKREITVRQLLSLVSGLDTQILGRETWTEAVAAPTEARPGEQFRYGSAPFQVFGALVERKTGRDPVALLQELVLDPIGASVAAWRVLDGHPTMAYGASLTADQWAKVGELVRLRGRWGDQQVLRADLVDELLRPSAAAPFYGLSWWLFRAVPRDAPIPGRHLPERLDPAIPADLVMSAGAGDQRLYVSAERHVVVVRQAAGGWLDLFDGGDRWSDVVFLRTLFERPGR